jgi:phosphate acetyltransferase
MNRAFPMPDYPHLSRIIAEARAYRPLATAVVMPTESTALAGAIEAARSGLLTPILVGPRSRIASAARVSGADLSGYRIAETADDGPLAAAEAVRLCLAGDAEAIMKGSLHTDELMRSVFCSALRTLRRASHAFLVDIPELPRPLVVTDAGVNIAPSIEEKLHIVQNAVDLAQAIGIQVPRVALLSAVETVLPQIPSSVDAAKLRDIARRGGVSGAIVDGPLALDLALSEESARIKGIDSPVAGRADILVVPGLESGNFLYKAMIYLARAEAAGIVLGARAPIILTSRSSSVQSRIASCALALLYTRRVAAARTANEPAIHADQLARPRA